MKGSFELRPEQWVLFGAIIFLGLIGLIKALMLPDIAASQSAGARKNPDQYDTEKIKSLSDRWNDPQTLSSTDHKVYVSRLIVYKPDSQLVEPLSDQGKIKGITVEWLKKYKLSLEDPNIAINDPDQDGFSNLEEFEQGTDPVEVKSHPDFVQKLCLKDYEFIPFKMEFKGYNPDPSGDGLVFQIKLPEVTGRKTRMVKKDADLEGYIIGEFRKKIVERYNEKTKITEKVDVSELDVIHPILKTPVTLVFNEIIESDESRVVFDLHVPNLKAEPSAVKRGEIFKIEDTSYQFIGATKTTAVIKQVDNGKEFTINECNK